MYPVLNLKTCRYEQKSRRSPSGPSKNKTIRSSKLKPKQSSNSRKKSRRPSVLPSPPRALPVSPYQPPASPPRASPLRRPKCPTGSIRNKKDPFDCICKKGFVRNVNGKCEPVSVPPQPVSVPPQPVTDKRKRCPKGTTFNKKTSKCEPK